MTSQLDAISEALTRLRTMCASDRFEGMPGPQLIAINDAIGTMRRGIDALQAKAAAEISRQSRRELGPDSLAKTQGFRSPTALIAATTGTTNGEAARLVQVGEATAPRTTLTGETAPARHPHVAAALDSQKIGTAAAAMIITMLDKVVVRAGAARVLEAEALLVEQAPGLTLDQVSKLVVRAEAWLDPDGVEPRDDELHAQRTCSIRQERGGAIVGSFRLAPEQGAPVMTAIQALVSAEMRAAQDAGPSADAAAPRLTVPQMQADALVRVCEHLLACEHTDLPLGGATVIVRVALDQLQNDRGHGTIDGIDAPVSTSAIRRMAADARIIPCVLGGDGQILDWGRAKRLFTSSQKLVLVERDGGCSMCGAPPALTKVHHIAWWRRDAGRTDLTNGVLLCTTCHHLIHDNGWEIRIDGPPDRISAESAVWFIPPPWVDPARTPRLGGRRRFDFLAA